MGYDDTKQKILTTLMQRPLGTQIQPENHQDFALSLLEYIRGVELISSSILVGIAYEDTVPIQSNNAIEAYITGVSQQQIKIYKNFIDKDGRPIEVITGEMESKFVVLIWNKQYWEKQEIPVNVISQVDKANFFYSLTIKKTYSSKAEMEKDVVSPMGNNKQTIKQGECVSIHNETNKSENAIYSYEYNDDFEPYWQIQTYLDALDSRNLDGGNAKTNYGGVSIIDGGMANQ